jgi:23S rRNA pseudouridine1911/1915/1917 synthase
MTEPEEDFPDYSKDDESADLLEMKVPMEHGGLRLDQVLVKLLPEYSRSRLQDWIEQGLVTLNGKAASVKQKVWGGETVRVTPQIHPSEQPYQAEDIPLDIVYEDDAIIVIDKHVGLVVHPGSGNWEGTLLNALLHHAPQLAEVPRAGIVHRLDKDTSGLMVVAKTLVAQTALVRQMQARSVKREYLALVWGELDRPYTINVPIGRHPTQRVKMATTESGKEAVTHVSIPPDPRAHDPHRPPADRRRGLPARYAEMFRAAARTAERLPAPGAARHAAGAGPSRHRRAHAIRFSLAGRHGRVAGTDRRGKRCH